MYAVVAAILLLCLVLLDYASASSITVDDANNTFFSFAGQWHAITPSDPCSDCFIKPNMSLVHLQTYHDGIENSTGQITFKGNAITIFGMGDFNAGGIQFTLDTGNSPVDFNQTFPSGVMSYDVPLFNASGLSEESQHTVSFKLTKGQGPDSISLIDYAVINVTDPTASSSSAMPAQTSQESSVSSGSSSKTPSIVGGVIAGVVVLALAAVGAYLLRRRRNRRILGSPSSSPLDPFLPPSERPMTVHSASGSISNPATSPNVYSSATHGTENQVQLSWGGSSNSMLTEKRLPNRPTDLGSGRVLEGRLAELESQIRGIQASGTMPPPYVPDGPGSNGGEAAHARAEKN